MSKAFVGAQEREDVAVVVVGKKEPLVKLLCLRRMR